MIPSCKIPFLKTCLHLLTLFNNVNTLPQNAGYHHDQIDDNAHTHLGAVFLGPSQTFSVKGGALLRGTWQNIFFIEMDGPRSRRVTVEVLGT